MVTDPPSGILELIAALEPELKSSVRNKVLCCSDDFVVMVVVGPNRRNDFHINQKPVRGAVCAMD